MDRNVRQYNEIVEKLNEMGVSLPLTEDEFRVALKGVCGTRLVFAEGPSAYECSFCGTRFIKTSCGPDEKLDLRRHIAEEILEVEVLLSRRRSLRTFK